jgi:lysophospholipase L1-like esterase
MTNRRKKILKWAAGIFLVITITIYLLYAFLLGSFVPGNAEKFSVSKTSQLPYSPLAGKTLFFLGSSVTVGFASEGESFVDYIRKRNNCICLKEAKSGTTLMDNGKQSYVERLHKFDTSAKVDAFLCQLSTNDTRYHGLEKIGFISKSTDRNDFDITTTIGAAEYIISYARETWNCPVIFYTNTCFGDKNYEVLINKLYEIKGKWNIEIIDLYNDNKLNNIPADSLRLYMLFDDVHPHKAGYKLWWTPAIEKRLYEIIGNCKQ